MKKRENQGYSPKVHRNLLLNPLKKQGENLIRDSILIKIGDYLRNQIFNRASKTLQ